ncbi:hypothetical protein E2C01_043322 [Portunus trituberculatus]|uniref:Uncharacterized protein n=1 Tax=Portunus trituberculatus TaxID=210409 RepID=A0A5B7FW06_PORTR|nr:hypothetical protein [Portunus trituberculatus]
MYCGLSLVSLSHQDLLSFAVITLGTLCVYSLLSPLCNLPVSKHKGTSTSYLYLLSVLHHHDTLPSHHSFTHTFYHFFITSRHSLTSTAIIPELPHYSSLIILPHHILTYTTRTSTITAASQPDPTTFATHQYADINSSSITDIRRRNLAIGKTTKREINCSIKAVQLPQMWLLRLPGSDKTICLPQRESDEGFTKKETHQWNPRRHSNGRRNNETPNVKMVEGTDEEHSGSGRNGGGREGGKRLSILKTLSSFTTTILNPLQYHDGFSYSF